MRVLNALFLLAWLLALPVLCGACASKQEDDGFNPVAVGEKPLESVSPDGVHYKEENPGYLAALELKLKARELGEQLVANLHDCSLRGTVALPVSFVNLNDFRETSALGRLMAEQMFYELNQRGFAVREYRVRGSIQPAPSPRAGEFILSRELGRVNTRGGHAVVVLGTYSRAGHAVFVNARLVRPRDGRVLRTASIVLDANSTVLALMADKSRLGSSGRGGASGRLCGNESGGMRIRDFKQATAPPDAQKNLTPFDQGQDIH